MSHSVSREFYFIQINANHAHFQRNTIVIKFDTLCLTVQ